MPRRKLVTRKQDSTSEGPDFRWTLRFVRKRELPSDREILRNLLLDTEAFIAQRTTLITPHKRLHLRQLATLEEAFPSNGKFDPDAFTRFGELLREQGNVLAHEYKIEFDGQIPSFPSLDAYIDINALETKARKLATKRSGVLRLSRYANARFDSVEDVMRSGPLWLEFVKAYARRWDLFEGALLFPFCEFRDSLRFALEKVSQFSRRGRGSRDLTLRQYRILEALLRKNATGPDTLMRTDKIATAAEGPTANPASFKRPIADLARRGLVGTLDIPGGGVWLMEKGQKFIENHIAKRHRES